MPILSQAIPLTIRPLPPHPGATLFRIRNTRTMLATDYIPDLSRRIHIQRNGKLRNSRLSPRPPSNLRAHLPSLILHPTMESAAPNPKRSLKVPWPHSHITPKIHLRSKARFPTNSVITGPWDWDVQRGGGRYSMGWESSEKEFVSDRTKKKIRLLL